MEISDEDKLIINGEMFFSIRKYIKQNKTNEEIIAKIDEMTQEGADINAYDSNDNNNTILHIAAKKCRKEVALHLLQRGARLYCNSDQETPMDLALKTNTEFGKEIAEILSKQDKPTGTGPDKSQSEQKIKSKQHYHNMSFVRSESVQEIPYAKRAGTSGVSGQFFETKLLSLVLHRALHNKEIGDFYLAANIKDIGDFDDVCFRYKNVACFIQCKHRENTDKAKLTVASIRSNTSKLCLDMYFDSFLKIRQKFSPTSNDPMFQGKFEDIDSYFVLYTPLKESFDRKLSKNKHICSKLHEIIYTGDNENNINSDIFQFDFEDYDLNFLTRYTKHEHMKSLAKTFLEFVLSNNKLEVMMANDLVKIYHPALAQKVILISKFLEVPKATKTTQNQIDRVDKSYVPTYNYQGIFRPDFFCSEDPNLIILKDTFYKEIVYTHSTKTNLSIEELKKRIQEIADNPCDHTISKLIGCPIKFDDTSDKLCVDITKLPKNKYKNCDIQQMKHDLRKIQVTRTMVRDAVYLAGRNKLQNLTFRLPQSFGNIDITTNRKTRKDVEERLNFLAERLHSVIKHFAERNKDKQIKIIDISSDIVGPRKILEFSHLNTNGGIGGAVGNLFVFDSESELFSFNTKGVLGENAQYILDKLKKLTNEDLDNYKINVILDGFPRASFDIYQYDKNIVALFLSKLWFYTNQAQEESVETKLKTEINAYYNFDKQKHQFLYHVHSDAIFLRFHDEIQKWWKKPIDSHYITRNTTIYEKAKKDIVDSPLLTVLNVMFIRKIKHLGIEFDKDAINYLHLNEFIEKDGNSIFNIVSDSVVLSAAKVMQNNRNKNNYSFINLDYAQILPQNDYEIMIEELHTMKCMTIVIVIESRLDHNLQEFLLKILNAYVKHQESTKHIIIITKSELLQIDQIPVFQTYDYLTLQDNRIKMVDLTSASQADFLDKYTLTYQGQDVTLKTIIDYNSKELLNAKTLWSFLNKEKIEIGHALGSHKYDEIKNYYVNRNIKRSGEEYAVGTLNDIEENIVLISSKPCMGKSILLTHLSLETKKIDPKPWIVRVNLSAYDKNFEDLKNNDINFVMKYLCKVALKKPDEVKKVNFSETDCKTVVSRRFDEGEDISFELQLFIHYYNSDNIIFLFDGFDKIYPNNANKGIKLLTVLKKAKKRMWITSDCYTIEILERNFGPSYKLDRLSTIQQKSFLHRFWATNIKLEKLNHEQLDNITLFFNYIMRIFNREINLSGDGSDRPVMPIFSLPLHFLYLTALDHFKNEIHKLTPHYYTETIKKICKLNHYTAFDHYLGRSIKEESLELAGTPLHMYIAANYFAFQITNKFDLHLDFNVLHDRCGVYINAVTLYERFLKVNIKHICEIENKTAVGKEQEKLRDNFFDSHKKLALYAICREQDVAKILTPSEIREVKNTIKMIESGEIQTYLIDTVVDGVPRFYHLLFAEYFVIEIISEILQRIKNQNHHDIKLDSFCNFLVNVVLMTSPPSLRNAFEYKLKYNPELAEVTNNERCNKIIFNLIVKPNQKTDENNTDNALNIAINEGLVNITNFLLKGIRNNVNDDNIGRLMTILKGSATTLSAADTSRSILSDEILTCIQNVDGKNIIALLNSKGIGKDIEDIVKTKIVEPVKKIAEKFVEFSENNENVVNLLEQLPNHLVDFVRQLKNK